MLIAVLNYKDLVSKICFMNFPSLGTYLSYISSMIILPTNTLEISEFYLNMHQFLENVLSDYFGTDNSLNVSLLEVFLWGSTEKERIFQNL